MDIKFVCFYACQDTPIPLIIWDVECALAPLLKRLPMTCKAAPVKTPSETSNRQCLNTHVGLTHRHKQLALERKP